jgi:hypothetical protein
MILNFLEFDDHVKFPNGSHNVPSSSFKFPMGFQNVPSSSFKFPMGFQNVPSSSFKFPMGFQNVPQHVHKNKKNKNAMTFYDQPMAKTT